MPGSLTEDLNRSRDFAQFADSPAISEKKIMTIPNRVTNADIYLLLGEIKGTTERLDKTINGNGKPGLVADHQDLKVKVEAHLKKAECEEQKAESKKEKLSARWWAVILVCISSVIGNIVVIASLYLRTGAIK